MDFKFTEEEEKFREEVRELLEKELPEGWVEASMLVDPYDSDERWAVDQHMRRKLAAKGWLTLGWPEEWGGEHASYVKQLILREELGYYRSPGRDRFGVRMLAAPLLIYGTEEQKKRHLGAIGRGEETWCEGFSEPGSGSDLASVQTRAEEDGDDYIINGQKTWTSNAHRADWCFLLARTDPTAPKHRGLSFFLVDMKTPGITVRPIINMADLLYFNEVFFDNVRIPKENLVGQRNRGWYVAMTLLVFERSSIERVAAQQRTLEQLLQYVKETRRNHEVLAKDPIVRQELAELSIEIEVCRMMAYHVGWMQSQGLVPDYEASMEKLFSSELEQKVARVGMHIMGLYGQLKSGSKWAPLFGGMEQLYLMSVLNTIGAGTSEIQRNVIATRGLGLPRN